MLAAFDDIPMNTGVYILYVSCVFSDMSIRWSSVITGKGNDSGPDGLADQVKAGVGGLKLHEVNSYWSFRCAHSGPSDDPFFEWKDWGSTPAAIDSCLSVCDEYDIACNIHTDTLNESAFCEGKRIE